MKVYIKSPRERLMCYIFTHYMNKKYGLTNWPIEYSPFEKKLEWLEDRIQNFYNIFNWAWFDRRKPIINVRIDREDTWSMDHTLAPIILPMLIQLKERKHGAPNVDLEDVPEDLHPTVEEYDEYLKNGQTDEKFFVRWDWVMGEMIYAFDCKANKDDVYMRFDVGDDEAMHAEQERISNGFRLFGKYYEALWD